MDGVRPAQRAPIRLQIGCRLDALSLLVKSLPTNNSWRFRGMRIAYFPVWTWQPLSIDLSRKEGHEGMIRRDPFYVHDLQRFNPSVKLI